MEVVITQEHEGFEFTITGEKPEIIEVIDSEPIEVIVEIVKDGKDGAPGEKGEPGTPAVNNTLEMVRSENETIEGNINANGNTIDNLKNATANQQPITKAQADAYLVEAKTYADTISAETVRWAGFYDASIGTYPTGSGIRRGDQFEISVAGTIAGNDYEVGDLIRARINAPGQTVGNWSSSQGNVQQATESRQGSAKISTPANAADENSTNDSDVITSKKLWQNFWQRVLSLSWTWNSRQIFSVSPRLSSLTGGNYLKLNALKDIVGVSKIPSSDIDGVERYFIAPDSVDRIVSTPGLKAHQFYITPANTFRIGSVFSIDCQILKTIVGNNGQVSALRVHTLPTESGGTTIVQTNQGAATQQIVLNCKCVVRPGNILRVFLFSTSNIGVGTSNVTAIDIPFDVSVDNYFYAATAPNNSVDIFTQWYFEIKGIY